jgi:predicted RNA-binding protein with PUA-like domain
MNYWIIKSEPDEFSIWDLENNENQRENWDGVRNYQVRNMIRDDIKVGDFMSFLPFIMQKYWDRWNL